MFLEEHVIIGVTELERAAFIFNYDLPQWAFSSIIKNNNLFKTMERCIKLRSLRLVGLFDISYPSRPREIIVNKPLQRDSNARVSNSRSAFNTGVPTLKNTCFGRTAKFVRESEDITRIWEKLFGKLQIISRGYRIGSGYVSLTLF